MEQGKGEEKWPKQKKAQYYDLTLNTKRGFEIVLKVRRDGMRADRK